MNDEFILEILRDIVEQLSESTGLMYLRLDGKLDELERRIKSPPATSPAQLERY